MTTSNRAGGPGGRRQRKVRLEDGQAAVGLLPALARTAAQRPLRRRRQAGGLSLARGLQAGRDRRPSIRLLKPGKRVVDLGAAPGGWAQVAADRVQVRRGPGAGGRHRPSGDGADRGRASSCSSTSWMTTRPARLTAMLRDGRADVVLSDMAAQGTGHVAHRSSAHHGARRGRGRVRLRGAQSRAGPSCARCSRAAPSASCWTG